ncbi:2-phosphosulfolactate phosphatase [Salinibacillus xinjiangensis]|uniref:Probable 2-phosphosulfolactate phosphatase n=1 Tax=Salinibacillus xinjiangensis TaxID=1229268 RepID=A0A6G1X4I6_9BACI|nr:2-phosphosulfolactate phosphatase [Salinibacillus xinjiangensis]MRG85874.1 2-phosphosulfolactate phosphatase [Salinibacillus xinjiangensis]
MRKINVITQKELVDSDAVKHCTVVVVDVFLATTTITHLLHQNYESVYTVKDAENALRIAKQLEEPYVLLGESNGDLIEGFQYPDPLLFHKTVENQTAIICSTNGTKAVEKAKNAQKLYVSSIVNGHVVAERIHEQQGDSSVVIVCSGNAGRFSMEDFVGAGQIVNHLVKQGDYKLSDSAKSAKDLFRIERDRNFTSLYECETSTLFKQTGFEETMYWVVEKFESIEIVPVYQNEKIIKEVHQNKKGSFL